MRYLVLFLISAGGLFSERQVPIEYGGMTIYCDYECDEPSDPDREKIDRIFARCVRKVFSRCEVLDQTLSSIWIDPWGRPNEGNSLYWVWDWKASSGIWPSDQIPRKDLILGSYSAFQEIANALREDLYFFYIEWPKLASQKYNSIISRLKMVDQNKYCNARISDGGNTVFFQEYEWFDYDSDGELRYGVRYRKGKIEAIIKGFEEEISCLNEGLLNEEKYFRYIEEVEKALSRIDDLYKHMFVFCLENHQIEGAAFSAAIENLILGEYEKGIGQIQFLIDFSEERNLGNQLLSKLYLLKGALQSEFYLYSDAIIGLTTAIQKDPSLKDAYLERAVAYFETGDFDKAIDDYLTYVPGEIDSRFRLSWVQIPPMAAGISSGVAKGGFRESVEFFPETLSTAKGLGQGLWACIKSPIGASRAFVDAAKECIQYVKTHTCFEFAQDIVPEFKELVQRYDELSDFQRGELIGQVIGKYGVDILLCKYSAKTIKAYKDLKRANQLMTLEVLASKKHQQEILDASKKIWEKRQEFLRSANLTYQWDKHGKHVIGAKNYEPSLNRSIFTHQHPERLIKEFAGTGIKDSLANPGVHGYREIVDFGEVIGFAVDQVTGEKFETTFGKIHYAKDGVHIVPFRQKK